MFLLHVYYRCFQVVFNIGARLLPWRKAKPIKGAGCIDQIPKLLKQNGVTKVMVVTDPGLMKAGVAQKILNVLTYTGMDYELFSDVQPNPTVATVNAVTDSYRDSGCNGFIAIGGGSSMDAAKAAAACITKPKKTVQQLGGLFKILKRIPPFIAVPTTAGTGSETTVAALITDEKTHHKYSIMDLSLVPHYAILDPELTVGLPAHITSTTGMDTLTHAVEAYLNRFYNTAESKSFALEAIAAVFTYLERAYIRGDDIEAREAMLEASYKAGFAFTRACVGNVHAVAHTLGGLYNAAHGMANAVILPVVLKDYGEKVYGKLSLLAAAAGIADPSASEEQNAKDFIARIEAMNERMNIPKGFDFIQDEDIPQMIAWALKECNPLYPVPVLYNAERYRRIIESVRI